MWLSVYEGTGSVPCCRGLADGREVALWSIRLGF